MAVILPRNIVFIIAPILLSLSALHSLEMKSVTVAGFINTGGPAQDSVNIMMTKSLITFLSKISKNVTPYSDLEPVADQRGYWKLKKPDFEKAIGIAQAFGTEQVITGDYAVDEKKDKISINVYVYDVVTAKLTLQRNYQGSAGLDIFDTIDKMIRDVSGLLVGKPIETGRVKITILPTDRIYRLLINGAFVKEVSNQSCYEDEYLAGNQIEIVLKTAEDDREVFRKSVSVEKEKTVELDYRPVAGVHLKVLDGESEVFIDGKSAGKTDNAGELSIPDLEAGRRFEIRAEKNGRFLAGETVTLAEGENRLVVLKGEAAHGNLYFPLMVGLHGGLGFSGGVDWYFLGDAVPGLCLQFTAGAVYFSSSNTNIGSGVNLIFNAGGAYMIDGPVKDLKYGISAGAVMFVTLQQTSYILACPFVNLEAEYLKFFISAGMRYSFADTDGGFYPQIDLGFRF